MRRAAETTAALLKLVSGSYSDRVHSRKGLVDLVRDGCG